MAQSGRGGSRDRDRDRNKDKKLVSRGGGTPGGSSRARRSGGTQGGDGGSGGGRFPAFGEPFERLGNPFKMFDEMSSSLSSRMSSMFQDDHLFNDPFFTQPFGSSFGTTFRGGLCSSGGGGGGGMERNPGGDGRANVQIEELPNEDDRGGSSNEPIIEHPDDEGVIGLPQNAQGRSFQSKFNGSNDINSRNCYSFQSSSVYSAGPGGPQYAARAIRRQGPEGIIEEEFQEKDTQAKKATHRLSHGLGDKGRSVTRKKIGDSPEETFQTLHNLAEDEVPTFERTWTNKAHTVFPKWNKGTSQVQQIGSSSRGQSKPRLPSSEH